METCSAAFASSRPNVSLSLYKFALRTGNAVQQLKRARQDAALTRREAPTGVGGAGIDR